MNVAIIPARGGSKRLPRKNIKPFFGRPVIYYSIRAAVDSGLFEHIIVSTDDDEIAQIAVECGARVPFKRPEELSDDHATMWQVMKHALGWCHDHEIRCDHACCIYPAAPLLQALHLQAAFQRLLQADCSYVFPVTTFPFPVQRAVRLLAGGRIAPFFPELSLMRSQEFEATYHDATQFYWGTVRAFMSDPTLYSVPGAATVIEIPRRSVQDIDTPEDWAQAELLYRMTRQPARNG